MYCAYAVIVLHKCSGVEKGNTAHEVKRGGVERNCKMRHPVAVLSPIILYAPVFAVAASVPRRRAIPVKSMLLVIARHYGI